jgi:hypothetical protein
MSFFVFVTEHKLAGACVAFAVAISAVIVALIVLVAQSTISDIQGEDQFNAITSSFCNGIEDGINRSLLLMEVVAALFSTFDVKNTFFQAFLAGLPEIAMSEISWAALVMPDQVAQFEANLTNEVCRGRVCCDTIFSRNGRLYRDLPIIPFTIRRILLWHLHRRMREFTFQVCGRFRSTDY